MTRKQQQARDSFEALLVQESGAVTWERDLAVRRAASLLCRHGVTYKRIQIARCNGVGAFANEDYHSFVARQERFERYLEHREQLLEKRITALVTSLGDGFGVILGGDPRGCVVKLTVPSGKTDDFGGEGICVPAA